MLFVIFRGESSDIYIPVFWVVLEFINFSLMVACYERDESWVVKEFISQ